MSAGEGESAAGKWSISMNTPLGAQNFVWDLRSGADGWTGAMDSQSGRSELKDLQVDGDQIQCQSRVQTPLGSLDLTFDATVDGERIGGTCRTSYGAFRFSGRRA